MVGLDSEPRNLTLKSLLKLNSQIRRMAPSVLNSCGAGRFGLVPIWAASSLLLPMLARSQVRGPAEADESM
jgi:hypothetical protein